MAERVLREGKADLIAIGRPLIVNTKLVKAWRDQEHRKFSQEFEFTMRTMGRFIESSQEQIPFLLRKAEQIEEYLS